MSVKLNVKITRNTKVISNINSTTTGEDIFKRFWELVKTTRERREDMAVEYADYSTLVFSRIGSERTTYTVTWASDNQRAKAATLNSIGYWVHHNQKDCTDEAIQYFAQLP